VHASEISKKEALDKFLAIKEAYETLSDPSKRVLYDQSIGYTSSLDPSVVFGSTKQGDFSSWASPTGMPEDWRTYQDQTYRRGFSFYAESAAGPDPFASEESYAKSKEEEKRYAMWAIVGGSLICLTGFASIVAYYNLVIDSTPSAMQEVNNYHRSRALILEFSPNDLQRQEEFLGKGKRFEAGPQWIGKKPPEYSLGATR
jgi:curved DNA-binding protein CbpA